MTETAASVKRFLGGSNAEFWMAMHNGTRWAENRFWLVPSARLDALLNAYNIAADATGAFRLEGGSVRKVDDWAPNVGAMLRMADYSRQLKRTQIAGRDAYARWNGTMLALFDQEDGETIGIRYNWLEWCSVTSYPGRALAGPDEHLSDVYYRQSGNRVGVLADRFRTVKEARFEGGRMIPAVTEKTGTMLLAVVASSRLP